MLRRRRPQGSRNRTRRSPPRARSEGIPLPSRRVIRRTVPDRSEGSHLPTSAAAALGRIGIVPQIRHLIRF